MGADALFCLEILMGKDCLCWIKVNILHEPTWLVSANRNNGKGKRTIVLASCLEVGAVSCIPAEINGAIRRIDYKTAPERRHLVKQAAAGAVAHLNKVDG